jgi:hypothetical protein
MSFFEQVKFSIYSPEYYRDIARRSFGNSIKYFFILVLLLTCVRSLFDITTIFVDFNINLQNDFEAIKKYYPADLVIQIKNGKITSNVTEPYYFSFEKLGKRSANSNLMYFVIIDTHTPYSPDAFYQYKTFTWLTSDSIVYLSKNGIKIINLSLIKDFKLDQNVLNSQSSKLGPLSFLLSVSIFFVGMITIYISQLKFLISILGVSFLVWILGKVLSIWNNTFTEIYKQSIHAITLSMIVGIVTDKLLFINSAGISNLLFYGLIFCILVINLYPRPLVNKHKRR